MKDFFFFQMQNLWVHGLFVNNEFDWQWEYLASGMHLLKESIFQGWIPSDYLGKLPSDIEAFMADNQSFKWRSNGKRSKETGLISTPC